MVAVVGGAVGAVAAVAGLIFLLVPDWQPEAEAGVELVESDVDREENIRADVTSEGSAGRVSVRSSLLSVTLRNTSDDPVMITRAEVRFRSVREVGCPFGAGGSEIKAQYNVKVPSGRRGGFTVDRKMRYSVPPHAQERVAFSVGPESTPEGALPDIYTFDVVLHGDDGTRLDVPEATMIASHTASKSFLANARLRLDPEGPDIMDPGCIRKEAQATRRAVAEAERTSPELREFSAQLSRIARRV